MSLSSGIHDEIDPPSSSRPAKRQRPSATTTTTAMIEQQVEIDEVTDPVEEDLESLLVDDGNDFLTDDQRQERDAAVKRRLRQQKFRQLLLLEEAQQNTEIMFEDNPSLQSVKAAFLLHTTNIAENSQRDTPPNRVFDERNAIRDGGTKIETTVVLHESKGGNDSDDDFNMFSKSVSPIHAVNREGSLLLQGLKTNTNKRGHGQQDWDDAEGYYKAVIGEMMTFDVAINNADFSDPMNPAERICLRVSGVIGKGVFSTVLKCTTISSASSIELPPIVAVKLIRHNETMSKAALKEIEALQRLNGSPGIVTLLLPTGPTPVEYRGHVVLAFSFMEYNLRDVLQKYGRGVGLALQAVRSYFGQMLAAATHLQKHGIIHADLKLDNILVSSDFGVVQLADFGSAFIIEPSASGSDHSAPTPYMVSRFYRAPEIILGLSPTFAIDLWSLAVTVGELFLGDVMFRGTSNNDMIFVFMQHLGPFPNRMIRQHLLQCQRLSIPRHFQQDGPNYSFTKQTVDPVSGANVYKVMSLLPHMNDNKFPSATPLHAKLMKAKSGKDSNKMVAQFSQLLQKCLALDPTKRVTLKDALRHDFFKIATTMKSSDG